MDLDAWAMGIVDHVERHMDTERDVLTQYRELAEDTSDERLRYLVHLILDDEVRHHRLLDEMANWLRAAAEHRPLSGPQVPSFTPGGDGEDTDGLRARTAELLGIEHQDLEELRDLRRQVTRVEDTSWWSALVETMEFDTRKHIRLLEFIQRELQA